MSAAAAARACEPLAQAPRYQRHRPEHTLLYRLVAQHYPAFVAHHAATGRPLPDYVQREFEAYLKCGRLEHGFLRLRCASCHAEHLLAFSCKRRGFCPSCGARRMAETAALLVDEIFPEAPVRQWVLSVPYPLRFLFACRPALMGAVLAVVYRLIARHLIRKAGFSSRTASTGTVTLNLHFHMLFLDGVYVEQPDGAVRFRWVPAPTSAELTALAARIAERVGRFLQRRGLLEQDAENAYLASGEADEDPMVSLFAPSITYRIAVGPQAGRKVFTLQTLPAYEQACADGVGKGAGFSLHAGVAARADERHKLERLCRYVSRPAVSEQRLSLAPGGLVRYQLKTPYKDGTTHVLLEPLDFLARLAALVPKPRVNLTRYHGVFAPHSRHRARVTRAGRGKGATPQARTEDSTPAERRAAMTWAQRLKRVFRVDIETCADCGGAVRIIACIEDPAVIEKLLAHLDAKATAAQARPPPCRSPPRGGARSEPSGSAPLPLLPC